MLFFKNKEQQSLIDSSRKALKNAEKKIEELTKQLNGKMKLSIENTEIKEENSKLKDVLKRINTLMICNKCNNDEALKRKIIELPNDH